jgi:hypothetical protein
MAKVTVLFGILLILLGIFGFVATGSIHPTALIPAAFGLLLGIFGFLAQTPVEKNRMLWMHIAVTIGLIGFLGTVKGLVDYFRMATMDVQVKNPPATEAKAAMAAMLLFYVILCVRSFVNARISRR